MNLFEIDYNILKCIDEETGEILNEELFDELKELRKEKINNVIKLYKNLNAENVALESEIEYLNTRKKKNKKIAENLLKLLDIVLKGEKYKTLNGEINYRKSKSVVVDENFLKWAKENNKELLNYPEPTPNKTKIKELLERGEELQYAKLVQNNNIKIK